MSYAPAVNKVLTNTYLLLSMTLAFSALCTYLTLEVPMTLEFAIGGFIGSLLLLFALTAFKNSFLAIPLIFAFTGDKLASLKGF